MNYNTGKTQQELQEEYNKFLCKLQCKAFEIRQDFEKLSPENRMRFEQEAQAFMREFTFTEAISRLANWKSYR